MTDIEPRAPIVDLQGLLDEHGIAPMEHRVAHLTELGMDLGITRLYGVEVALPAGIIGKLVVRQVEQLPDKYVTGLPTDDSRVAEFKERRMSGLLADVQVRSVSPTHLLVARKSILQMQNTTTSNRMTMQTSKSFGMGTNVDTGNLLDFDTTGLTVARQLALPEMDYSEPSTIAMVFAALKRR